LSPYASRLGTSLGYDTTVEALILLVKNQPHTTLSLQGGGLAGLALAARLSNKIVLVVEAGLSGDDVADRIISEKFVIMFIWKIEPSG